MIGKKLRLNDEICVRQDSLDEKLTGGVKGRLSI